jgi:hypothetical protein
MNLESAMKHSFSEVPKVEMPRSSFDRTHTYKTTFDAGLLIPIYSDEALPGDTFVMDATMFGRLITPITPIMDNLYMDSFWFAVPMRLLWSNFQRFMGEQTDPGDSTDYTIPQIVAPVTTGWTVGTISDYLGIPTDIDTISISALYHRAYNLIWNEWFRDENLQDSVAENTGDGPDSDSDYTLLRRGKRHDYFTSALPWPQKGDAITLPMTGNAPVEGLGKVNQIYGATPPAVYETGGTSTVTYDDGMLIAGSSSDDYDFWVEEDPNNAGYPNLKADLSGVTAATINELREAFALQRMAEKEARGGSRYTEILKAHFGVTSPDQRLQRPEFLGGKTTPIQIMAVEQTSESNTTPQGTVAAYGTVTTNKDGFAKSFTEHCLIIGLVSVRADLTYQQGIERRFSRSTKYDFYWPSLAHLGEQEILNKEIYAQGDANDTLTFGYQERWAEYRYKTSLITGELRSTYATSLDIWHLSQEFTSLPTLSDAWIQDTPPVDRITAITDEPHIIYDSFLRVKSVRPMPKYSVPGNIDRF